MSFTEKKREEIRKYILRKIAQRDGAVLEKTMDSFGISNTTVKRYLKEAIAGGIIESVEGEECPYRLVQKECRVLVSLEESGLEEDVLFDQHIAPYLSGSNERARAIWQYCGAEILNNAIEHSRGTRIGIVVQCNALNTTVVISDDGVGVFSTLMEYMKGNGWEHPRAEDALVELYKGKITCDSRNHSGEGIFFSSKMMDSFILWSDSLILKFGNQEKTEVVQSHLAAYASRIWKESTMVMMTLENETEREAGKVFDLYADVDDGFVRTRIPVKEACITGEPVARSQARRICHRLETFREVILDFSNVTMMGQGFADELFRVYAVAHPEVMLRPVNMLPQVERMIRHVGRGESANNIIFPASK